MYGEIGTFIKDFHDAMFFCGLRIILGRLKFLVPKNKVEKSCGSSHKFLDFYVDKAFAQKGSLSSSKKSLSLLEGLVEETDDKVEIRNQTLQALMAASDTISILSSNTIWLLARYPLIWKQLREEILSTTPEVPTVESLNARGLLRNVLLECKSLSSDITPYLI